jgi:riboflavin biosynthesis pyrimidine reductase
MRFPPRGEASHVIANFVSTLDGVVALNSGGRMGGAEISGGDVHDRMLMGVLRAIADIIVVGNGTLRGSPRHRWTPESVAPSFSDEFRELRLALELPPRPTVVVVSASGDVDLRLPLFTDRSIPSAVLTTHDGARSLRPSLECGHVDIVDAGSGPSLTARAIFDSLVARYSPSLILTEGGPRLMGSFLAESAIDELFLTIAPQVAGRDRSIDRPGLVDGQMFAPNSPVWASLTSVRQLGGFLYLRYGFDRSGHPVPSNML